MLSLFIRFSRKTSAGRPEESEMGLWGMVEARNTSIVMNCLIWRFPSSVPPCFSCSHLFPLLSALSVGVPSFHDSWSEYEFLITFLRMFVLSMIISA